MFQTITIFEEGGGGLFKQTLSGMIHSCSDLVIILSRSNPDTVGHIMSMS